jgi:hypothetical protein
VGSNNYRIIKSSPDGESLNEYYLNFKLLREISNKNPEILFAYISSKYLLKIFENYIP